MGDINNNANRRKEVFVYDYCENTDGSYYLFAISPKGCNTCVRVTGFKPHIYIEIPESRVSDNKDDDDDDDDDISESDSIDEIVQNGAKTLNIIISTYFQMKKKLFYNHKILGSNGEFIDTLFPYIKVEFRSTMHMYMLCKHLRLFHPHLKVHENNVPSFLKLMTARGLTTTGWIGFEGTHIASYKKTQCCYEYVTTYTKIFPPNPDRKTTTVCPKVMCYDIEVYSSNENVMPQAANSPDAVFQISASISTSPDHFDDYLLTIGPTNTLFEIPNVQTHVFETEAALIVGFKDFVQKHDPNIICGYNIMGFDEGYLMDRARLCGVITPYTKKGMVVNKECKQADIQWSSSAMSNRAFRFLDGDGRVVVDLLEIIKRDYKFDNYKLATVAQHFMNDTKADLSVKGIFRAYRLGMKALVELKKPVLSRDTLIITTGLDALKECGEYCVKDSVLVSHIFHKIQCWTQLSEMAMVCCVNIKDLITRGQQLKVFSQVYSLCSGENTVVERDGYITSPDDQYEGAYVVAPVPGVYDNVVPFDFASLYPTTMIAYNICYSTLVTDNTDISDEHCHVIEWDSIDANNQAIQYKYRFLKSPPGILPRLLRGLLDARKNTRSLIKKCDKTVDKAKIAILDKRQLAYKVSSNSVYGSLGVRAGYLPFLPGAMCTTAMGRHNIRIAQSHIQSNYAGELVYGDTDSCYIHFPEIALRDLWKFCLEVESNMRALFPAPIELLFEEAIYKRFFILTKKRYMAIKVDENLKESSRLLSKGVVLTRRDNAECIRQVYEEIVRSIMQKTRDKATIQMFLCDQLDKVCSHYYPVSMYTVTKKIGAIPDYATRDLSTDRLKRAKRFKELEIEGECACKVLNTFETACAVCSEYKFKTLPAHILLAEKMRSRGLLVEAGERVEYIVTDPGNYNGSVRDKIEDPVYHRATYPFTKLDMLYYVKLMGNVFDECLEVGYGLDKFMKKQYKLRLQKQKCCMELLDAFASNIVIN